MPDIRSRAAKASLILLASFVLSACVQSKTPLLVGSKPLLGAQFQLNLSQDFTGGKALSEKTSVFRWNRNHYSLVSGDSSGVNDFVIQPFDGNDFLIEVISENDIVYLLARKMAKGTYRILPVETLYNGRPVYGFANGIDYVIPGSGPPDSVSMPPHVSPGERPQNSSCGSAFAVPGSMTFCYA